MATLASSASAQAQKTPCNPSQYQLCLDLPDAGLLRELDASKTAPPQRFEQLQRSESRTTDPAHDRRMKLDDNTSVGLGRGGIGIKRSF